MSCCDIYIVLTYTGTPLARIIKYYTKAEFSHVSIALDKELNEMYSFGRLNPYNPFIGGLVHECVDSGTFKRFKNTNAAIYSYNISKEQYILLKKNLYKMYNNKKKFKFNTLGLFANGLNIKIQRRNYFYCAEFVKYLADKAELNLELPNLVRPNDFKKVKSLKLEYKGKLRDYKEKYR